MGLYKNQLVGANSPEALVFINIYLLIKIHVALDKKCGEEQLICVISVILSSSYSSRVRLEEQMRTDF